MKIIHCADIHLDSPLNSILSYEKAKVRKREILLSFLSLVDFAVENDVRAVIIAGDLFDSNIISSETEKTLFEKISSDENIDFLYLKGNHDFDVKFKTELPKNFKMFQNEFNSFCYDNVCIGGVFPTDEDYSNIDFDNKTLSVNKTLIFNTENKQWYFGPVKTFTSNIPVSWSIDKDYISIISMDDKILKIKCNEDAVIGDTFNVFADNVSINMKVVGLL